MNSVENLAPSPTEQLLPRQRILIVDDSTITIRLLADLLSDMAEVFFVTDAFQALAKAKEVNPALILLDVMMPGTDGYQLAQQLKLDPETNQIPFIFVTARSDGIHEEKGLEVGAVDYISKPILPAVVRARVRNQLQLQYMNEQLKMANEELRQLANRDPLTDAYNRRRFLELAESARSFGRRNLTPLSLIMMDIDHFKLINDQYGHDCGDKALVALVKVCNDILREVDSLGRLGGEEFAILLPDTPAEGARIVAERLREGIADIVIGCTQGDFGLTASMGISELKAENDNINKLMKRADEALYRAKNEGRNRVLCCSTVVS